MTYTYELVMPDGVVFQSTYRSRGMTTLEFACVQLLLISIHIPLARYDLVNALNQADVLAFQSTYRSRGMTKAGLYGS